MDLQEAPRVEKYLLKGNLDDGELILASELDENPKDDQLRFGLGMLQFLRAIEGLAQDLHRYGLRDHSGVGMMGRFLQSPLPANKTPETISYEKARKIVETFHQRLTSSEATLAAITAEDVKLPLHFGMIRLDLTGDRHYSDEESLWKLYASRSNNSDIKPETAEKFLIKFDRGDVHWLRGYCHVFLTFCEVLLAHDTRDMFERTAHLVFSKVDTPYQFLTKGKHIRSLGRSDIEIMDLIAVIHLISWDVIEPKRMEAALHHMEAIVEQSRISWKYIMAETDDDHEWLPNPRQTGVIPNMRVTEEMVVAWSEIMNESERILKGELLIPFWRGEEGQGINLRKVFLEPRKFDLVLWVQGTGAAPYVETGALSKGNTWRELRSQFGGNFPGFAIWFN